MNFKVFFLVCVAQAIAFDQYNYEDYEEPSTTSTTIPTTTTTTTTTTPTTTTSSSPSPRKSQFTSTTPVLAEGDAIKKGSSYNIDSAATSSGFRTKEGGENSKKVYRHRNERQQNPKCVTEDDLVKKIHEIFLTSQQPPATTEFVVDDSLEWDASTTTIRVERDHPNPLGPVRNF
jgi:hypothetical protein